MSRRFLVSFALVAVAACSSSASPPADVAAPAGEVTPAAASELKPLAAFLANAAALKVYSLGADGRKLLSTLDATATKAYLAKLDLTQKADGPLVRCPSDTLYELADASGNGLGTIGFCGAVARFDGPDGKFGGIRASRL